MFQEHVSMQEVFPSNVAQAVKIALCCMSMHAWMYFFIACRIRQTCMQVSRTLFKHFRWNVAEATKY